MRRATVILGTLACLRAGAVGAQQTPSEQAYARLAGCWTVEASDEGEPPFLHNVRRRVELSLESLEGQQPSTRPQLILRPAPGEIIWPYPTSSWFLYGDGMVVLLWSGGGDQVQMNLELPATHSATLIGTATYFRHRPQMVTEPMPVQLRSGPC